jgi:L-aspartate oxidase
VVDDLGERFLFNADPAGELAGRDVVARAISERMAERSLDNVWLDLRPIGAAKARVRFPNIVATCAGHGIDITEQLIPVAPAAHYQMGGVRTDLFGATSVPGLFAAGEVASTGVHGANRLASNSLLESLVFAARAVEAVLGEGERAPLAAPEPAAEMELEEVAPEQLAEARRQLQEAMWSTAGIVREREGLARTAARLALLADAVPELPVDPHLCELRGMLGTSSLLVEAADYREESRGAHFRRDHPSVESRFLGTVIQKRGVPLEFRPIEPARTS